MPSKYIEPHERLEVKQSIDSFTEGVYCHSRLLGEKVIPMHYTKTNIN